jgi:CRISPR-associated protein Cas2
VALTVLVCYDISRDASRAKVAAYLQQWGDRIQRSVYICAVAPEELSELVSRVEQMIDPDTDAVAPAAHLRDVLVSAGGPGSGRRGSRPAVLDRPVNSVAGWLLRSGDGSGRSTSSLACRLATCANTARGTGSKIGYWPWWVSRAAASRTCWSATRPRG